MIIVAIYRYAPTPSRRDPEIIYNDHYQPGLESERGATIGERSEETRG